MRTKCNNVKSVISVQSPVFTGFIQLVQLIHYIQI